MKDAWFCKVEVLLTQSKSQCLAKNRKAQHGSGRMGGSRRNELLKPQGLVFIQRVGCREEAGEIGRNK